MFNKQIKTNQSNLHAIEFALLNSKPELFYNLYNTMQDLESQALNEVDQLPVLYNTFCTLIGDCAGMEKRNRQTVAVITQRRMFIAVAVCLYDPVFLNNYRARMRDNLRYNMAVALQCCPEWISTVIPSLLFEYNHINTFRMQIDLIAYYLKQGVTVQAA